MHGVADFDELKPLFIIAYSGDRYMAITINDWGRTYNGMPSSIAYILTNKTGLNQALTDINAVKHQGDKIVTVFSIPELAVDTIYQTRMVAYERNEFPLTR